MKTGIELWLIGLAIFALAFSASAVEKGDIRGYWPADEGSGNIVADVAGGLDGTLMVGPGWEGKAHDKGWGDGRFGKGLLFDENKDWFVHVGTNEAFDELGKPNAAFSVVYWLKSDKVSGKGRTMEKGSSGWTQGWHAAIVNGKAFSEGCDNVAPGWQLTGRTTVADDEWHHLVHVFNLDTLKAKIYVDAKLDGESDISADKDIAGREWPIVFGSVGEVVGNPWHEFLNGTMDEMAIFTKELEPGEIEQVMSEPIEIILSVKPTDKLVTYWGALKANH